MDRTIVITGAASGIGRATAENLRAAGHRVIGVDLRDVEVIADLSTPAGRAAMAEAVAALAPDGIDSVVAVAGMAAPAPAPRLLAVNYFGAVATLELLRPLLLRSQAPRAVAIVSTASLSDYDPALVEACLAGDEAAALAQAEGV
ncbi:MAG TPA: SDR family NAD(P)-dependent oxidoreductase, partial [Novosphingobium sp.]